MKAPAGRIRPFVLAILIIVSGLLLEKPWWWLGLLIIVILFVEASVRYGRMR